MLFLFISGAFSGSAVGSTSARFLPLLPLLLAEISLPPTREIAHQGDTSYCGLYALGTFLELWGNARNPNRRKLPTLEAGFLGYAYNRLVGSAANGTRYPWLFYAVHRYGIVPKGSFTGRFGSAHAFPEEWPRQIEKLIDVRELDGALTSRYRHRGTSRLGFSPRRYLSEKVSIDFRDFALLENNHAETFVASEPDTSRPPYRIDDKREREAAMKRDVEAVGLTDTWQKRSPERLYSLLKAQLYAGYPVLAAIHKGLIWSLGSYHVFPEADLADEGNGTREGHAVVAVAHCDDTESTSPICRRFNREMISKRVPECIVFQNSWGPEENAQGYFCVSRVALRRLLYQVVIAKSILRNE